MIEQFQNHILNRFSFLQKRKLLIAISGGIDSVVLTHLCHDLHFNTALAHCNFNLRGNESDADEEFVLQLAENLNLEVFIESFDTKVYAKSNKLSIQMAARDLRYHWFKELAEQLNFDYILTAHHADDNLETFLINLSRGTGLDGLTGISEVNDNLVRPLLSFSREMIERYAKEKNYKWCEDSSNSSKKYVRNKLRLDIIPALKDLNPNFLQSFQTTLNNLNDTADIVEESLNAVLKRAIVSIDNSEMQIKVSAFKKLNNPKAYLYEFLKDYGFTEWNDVVNLLDAQSGKQVFSPKYRLLKDRDVLILKEIDSNESDVIISISEADSEVQLPLGAFVLSDVSQIEETNSRIIYVDKETLKFPLTLRKWGQGDYFYPSGMQGKKKLSKYFKDEKLSLIEKENIWLLCSSEDVVWVIGMRTDRRFKVRGSTRNILKIKLV